jgi:hypothetical protein
MERHHDLDGYPRLCFALATDQDITPLLSRKIDFKRIFDALRLAESKGIALKNDRVSLIVVEGLAYDSLKVTDLKYRETNLEKYGFFITPQDVDQIFQNMAYRFRRSPLIFTETFLAADNRNITLNPEISEKWPEIMMSKGEYNWADVDVLLVAEHRGSPLPREVIIHIVRSQYPQWDDKEQRKACDRAPSWMLAEIDSMAVARLEEDLGL